MSRSIEGESQRPEPRAPDRRTPWLDASLSPLSPGPLSSVNNELPETLARAVDMVVYNGKVVVHKARAVLSRLSRTEPKP